MQLGVDSIAIGRAGLGCAGLGRSGGIDRALGSALDRAVRSGVHGRQPVDDEQSVQGCVHLRRVAERRRLDAPARPRPAGESSSYFGSKVKTIYKENVPEGPQTAQVIKQLINSGAKIIFATSFGYQPAMLAAAKAHPSVYFAQATGTDMATNLSEYGAAGEDGDYLAGMAAGYATKTGKIGFVAPFPIPEVIREIDSYTMGARYVHPGATVKVVWTNSWFDPATERSAAQSLVASGVDVLGDGVDDPDRRRGRRGQRAQVDRLRLQPEHLRPEGLPDRDRLQLGSVLRQLRQGGHERHLEEQLHLRRTSPTT